MGRESFAENKGINLEKDCFTITEFISKVDKSYGSNVIMKLKEKYTTS